MYDHRLWSSSMVIVYGRHLGYSSMVVVCGGRLWWSSIVVVYGRHRLWSWSVVYGRDLSSMVVICRLWSWSVVYGRDLWSSFIVIDVVYRHVCYTNRHTPLARLVQQSNLPLESYSCLAHEALVSCSSLRSLSISATKPLCGRNSRSFISIFRRRCTPIEDWSRDSCT